MKWIFVAAAFFPTVGGLHAQDRMPAPDVDIASLHMLPEVPRDSTRRSPHLLYNSLTFNKARFYSVTGGIGVGTGLSLVLLNQYWYANYPREQFHFFDDSGEWLQIDKASHAFSSYFLSMWASELYQWSGLAPKKSNLLGAATGSALLLTVEVLDGFSSKWGASLSDVGANLLGAGLFLTQAQLFKDQHIRLKVSGAPRNYDGYPADVQQRARDLFGTAFLERAIKDYNSIALWMSLSPRSILGLDDWPRWLNIAFGYGAQNLFGGFENTWPGMVTDPSQIPRYRQWYISPDIDLTKIIVRKPIARLALGMLNILKFPAPAIEYSGQNGLRFHFVFF